MLGSASCMMLLIHLHLYISHPRGTLGGAWCSAAVGTYLKHLIRQTVIRMRLCWTIWGVRYGQYGVLNTQILMQSVWTQAPCGQLRRIQPLWGYHQDDDSPGADIQCSSYWDLGTYINPTNFHHGVVHVYDFVCTYRHVCSAWHALYGSFWLPLN